MHLLRFLYQAAPHAFPPEDCRVNFQKSARFVVSEPDILRTFKQLEYCPDHVYDDSIWIASRFFLVPEFPKSRMKDAANL